MFQETDVPWQIDSCVQSGFFVAEVSVVCVKLILPLYETFTQNLQNKKKCSPIHVVHLAIAYFEEIPVSNGMFI